MANIIVGLSCSVTAYLARYLFPKLSFCNLLVGALNIAYGIFILISRSN